ncbi:hypothetical protein CVT25_008894 [Psilocybe cyanescens]|uniref:Major facilitator superfamily (MFS) profile domain-containing protein n=1 Tax=Psilocybe cyanescens TaxID=93625 RepID=A0A409XNJ7_PSICY|nr:hypothetical protein CVT25_008894 [Psilocybe cyanescens]
MSTTCLESRLENQPPAQLSSPCPATHGTSAAASTLAAVHENVYTAISEKTKADALCELHTVPATTQIESDKTSNDFSESSLEHSVADGWSEKPDTDHRLPPLQFPNSKLSKLQKRNSLYQFLSLCYCIWLAGWNDGTTGPLLPRLQEHYNVGFSVVSMIFVGSCFGFICGAVLNIWLNDRLGLGKILVLGTVCQLCGYAIIIPAPPFPLLVCAYVLVGFGVSFQNAQANGFVGSLNKNMTTKLGVMHGAYGLGALTSPFASTYFSRFPDRRWANHFIFSAAFAVVNVAILIYVFRLRRQEEVLLDAGQEPNGESGCLQQQRGSKYRQIFALKCVPFLTAFALIYIGVEVTLGGWSVTFIIRERGGGSSSGYISSGFFGGWLLTGCIGLVTGIGVAGSAALPFITGVLASKFGIGSLQPLLVEEAYIRVPEPMLHAATTKLSERTKRPPTKEPSVKEYDKRPLNVVSNHRSETSPGVSANADANQIQSTTSRTPKTKVQKRNSTIQFISLCWCIWLGGWNDGSTGPLLPRLQEHYNVRAQVPYSGGVVYSRFIQAGYTIVSLIFVGSCFGFICGAFLNIWLNDRIGIGKILAIGSICQLCGYAIIIPSPPFPLLVCAYYILGFGLSLQVEILRDAGEEPIVDVDQQQQGSQYRQIFSLKSVPLFAIFALIYVGVEVTIGGWIVTFIIHERGGGSSTGYISSGFFGGLALGRVSLMWLNKMVGEHRIVILYALIAIAFELTVWFVPSIIENAVAVSLVGLVLGPMFPLLVSHMTHILPRWLLTGCVGLVTGIGVAGSAALPFITGLLASRFGIGSIQPLMISMMSVMLIVWAFVPKAVRRVE